MPVQAFTLFQLGWRSEYSQHLTLQDFEAGYPARVVGVQRSGLTVLGSGGAVEVALPPHLAENIEPGITIGDWVLVEHDAPRVQRLLERRSLIARLAAGTERRAQAIAANLDSLFVVSSCNDDFNLSRLERYLALAFEARVEPVIVLTKADLCVDVSALLDAVRAIAPTVATVAIDATSAASVAQLTPWLEAGHTVAFVGSSGVGKSTLANTLLGHTAQATGGIREADARGRHTTTARAMLPLPSGAWVIDTPGMRELRLGAAESGVSATFDDIEALAMRCRFSDCRHDGDRDCAVQNAVVDGHLDARRLVNYHKLQREAAQAERTAHERHEHARHFGRVGRAAQQLKRERRERDD